MTEAPIAQPGVSRRGLVVEVAFATAAVLAVARVAYALRGQPPVGPHAATIVGFLLLAVPTALLWQRRRAMDFLALGAGELLRGVAAFAVASVVAFPPFLLGAHLWERIVVGAPGFHAAAIPDFWSALLAQLFVVALPEEFYFRGYLQSALNLVFPRRWRFLGAELGWGWIVTAAVFAVAHSFIAYQWWHFAIFFPALLFGYLRERTGSIVAPILFHAASNLLMAWLGRSYS